MQYFASPVLAFLLLFQGPASNDAAEGLKALEEQRWDAAVASLTRAVGADPKNFALHFNLAFGLSMAGRTGDAIREYKTTLEEKPGLYEAELNLGVLLLGQKQAAEAIPLLQDAVRQKPDQFRPNWYAAEALLAGGKPADAIPLFRKAVEIDPKSKDATTGLARALAKDGKLTEADPLFRQAGELLELASLYEAAGKTTEAVGLYLQVTDNPAAQERAGELLLESGKAEQAIVQLEAAVQSSPTPANRFALSSAYTLTKQYDKAEPLLAAALAAEPNNVQLRLNYARVLRQQRKFAPAAQEFAKVVNAKPDSVETWSDLAGMLILLENYPQAIAALDRVRALGGEKPVHLYFRAIVLDKNHVYDQALESYEKFLASSNGQYPDEEFKAKQRVRILRKEAGKR